MMKPMSNGRASGARRFWYDLMNRCLVTPSAKQRPEQSGSRSRCFNYGRANTRLTTTILQLKWWTKSRSKMPTANVHHFNIRLNKDSKISKKNRRQLSDLEVTHHVTGKTFQWGLAAHSAAAVYWVRSDGKLRPLRVLLTFNILSTYRSTQWTSQHLRKGLITGVPSSATSRRYRQGGMTECMI